MNLHQRQAINTFTTHLIQNRNAHPEANKVLIAPDPSATTLAQELTQLGFEIEEIPSSKDLRFLSPPKESYAGIWSGETWPNYPIDDAQRILAIYFQTLKPKTGVIFAATQLTGEKQSYSEKAFGSLVRQSGFQILIQAKREDQGTEWMGWILKRI